MARVVYFSISRIPTGGQKIIFRHAEALAQRGFDAVVCCPSDANTTWFEHRARIVPLEGLIPSDIMVIGEDALPALDHFRKLGNRIIVFCQNHFFAGSHGIGTLPKAERSQFKEFVACSQTTATWVKKAFPEARVDVIPAFADERVFRPGMVKQPIIAYTPHKIIRHAQFIRNAFSQLYEGPLGFQWISLDGASERAVAHTFSRAALFLSLNYLEGLGITTLEAMAAGCLPVGFTGIGGHEYARPSNGFWVGENDCEAAADALVRAANLFATNDPLVATVTAAALGMASCWTYSRSIDRLEAFWIAALNRGKSTP